MMLVMVLWTLLLTNNMVVQTIDNANHQAYLHWQKQDEDVLTKSKSSLQNDEDEDDLLLLPTIHPNSVLPFHPKDLNYEDYAYEEYEDDLQDLEDNQMMVTKPYLPPTTPQPFLSKIGSVTEPVF